MSVEGKPKNARGARLDAQLARETTCVQRSFALQDGRSIRLGAERFRAPEALFRPSLLDVESPGIAELAFRCVQVSSHASVFRTFAE